MTTPLKTRIKRLIRDIWLITTLGFGLPFVYLFSKSDRAYIKEKWGIYKFIIYMMQEGVWDGDKIEDEIREKGVTAYFTK